MYGATVAVGGKEIAAPLSFQANEGGIVAITGGKAEERTAILEAMLGFLPLKKGWVSIDGEPVLPQTASYFRNSMSYMPRLSGLTEEGVADFLKYVAALKSNKDCIYSKEAVTEEWNLLSVSEKCYDKKFSELTADIAQRIRLSLVGLFARPIAILDSPTSAQNENGRIAVLSYLCSEKFKHIATVVATDDPAILSICNKTININSDNA